MDAIAAINGRIATIQHTLAGLAPSVPSSAAGGTGATASGAGSFADLLATEVAGRAGSTAAAAVGSPTSSARPEQVANATAIVRAGRAMGLSVRDQTIGVMTALGESSLTVLNHGDVAGPDSRGLFQQRANGAWGTLADRMDPTVSATNFFAALTRVQGRDGMDPTLVAHAVQRNADPQHYAKYWNAAVALVGQVAGAL